ncbi:MAG: hypothetical protein HYZ52_03350 [Candidatus Omnitrophica bacterium]|nr:hypothetical protein [Candidatus Omnitrophota bacterium]
MFTKEDFKNYFGELEGLLKETLVIHTDLLNEVHDRSLRNKLLPLMTENMEAFRWLKQEKEKLF